MFLIRNPREIPIIRGRGWEIKAAAVRAGRYARQEEEAAAGEGRTVEEKR